MPGHLSLKRFLSSALDRASKSKFIYLLDMQIKRASFAFILQIHKRCQMLRTDIFCPMKKSVHLRKIKIDLPKSELLRAFSANVTKCQKKPEQASTERLFCWHVKGSWRVKLTNPKTQNFYMNSTTVFFNSMLPQETGNNWYQPSSESRTGYEQSPKDNRL